MSADLSIFLIYLPELVYSARSLSARNVVNLASPDLSPQVIAEPVSLEARA